MLTGCAPAADRLRVAADEEIGVAPGTIAKRYPLPSEPTELFLHLESIYIRFVVKSMMPKSMVRRARLHSQSAGRHGVHSCTSECTRCIIELSSSRCISLYAIVCHVHIVSLRGWPTARRLLCQNMTTPRGSPQ
jgi:hypothetical protein